VAAPEVLAEAGALVCAGAPALVCEAPLAAAGEFCAPTGPPNEAASRMAVIDPVVAMLLFTLVPLADNSIKKRKHTPLASLLAIANSK